MCWGSIQIQDPLPSLAFTLFSPKCQAFKMNVMGCAGACIAKSGLSRQHFPSLHTAISWLCPGKNQQRINAMPYPGHLILSTIFCVQISRPR